MAKQQREAAVGFKRLRRVFPDGDVVARTDTGVRERAGFVGVCERAKETEQIGELFERFLAREGCVGHGASEGEDVRGPSVVGEALRQRTNGVRTVSYTHLRAHET